MSVDLIVQPGQPPSHGVLRCETATFACVLGRSGLRLDKHEGDGATPAGRFALRRVLYRADRIAAPVTKLPLAAIARDDGWCDESTDPNYNRPVKLPYGASAEQMWREDGLYDLVVILGHNDAPVVPGHGSAIFLHVMSPEGLPTAGCVALTRDHLLSVLAVVDRDSFIAIKNS